MIVRIGYVAQFEKKQNCSMRESKFTFSSDVEFEFIIQVQVQTRSRGAGARRGACRGGDQVGQPLMKLCRKIITGSCWY